MVTAMARELEGPETDGPRYNPVAVFYWDSDCVEYIKEDAFCIYSRIDEYLTLMYDVTGHTLIGFKLKGFKNLFERYLKTTFKLNDRKFVHLVSAIESVCTSLGDTALVDVEECSDPGLEIAGHQPQVDAHGVLESEPVARSANRLGSHAQGS
jgi:hypothetical protein